MKYKTCWISDIHLGSNKAKAKLLLSFLKSNEFETLYIVGDFVDIWRWQQSGFLSKRKSKIHIEVVQKILQISKHTKIVYVLGNHDEFLAHFILDDNHRIWGNIDICEQVVHTTVDDKKILVIHGHQFDLIVRSSPWIAKFGDRGYEFMIWLNDRLNNFRKN